MISGKARQIIGEGLKTAFSQAGGAKALGRRVLGGAAIGGAATGTISALRGGDFWEGAKGGALAGGIGGAGRHAWQMGQTPMGVEMRSSFNRARENAASGRGAASGGGMGPITPSNINSNNPRMGGGPSAYISGPDNSTGYGPISPSNISSGQRQLPGGSQLLLGGPSGGTYTRTSSGGLGGTMVGSGSTSAGINSAKSPARQALASASRGGSRNRRRNNSTIMNSSQRRNRNVSKQVHTQTRLSGTNSAAQSVVKG